jgi:NAD(P)-dependent dehydrogenase (short-subunit alcohol dehydrogenase family)
VYWERSSLRKRSLERTDCDRLQRGMVRDSPEINKRVADMTALGRAGVPDDVGPMIAALLSDENRWVNGQRIEVSGGMAL